MKEILMHNYIEKEFNKYKFRHEVKFFRKKIDFTFIDSNSEVHAIELKVRDWKSALNLIDTNQLCANYCYLGIWYKNEKLVTKKIIKKYGFGLISVEKDKCDIIINPKKSPILNINYHNFLKKQIEGD